MALALRIYRIIAILAASLVLGLASAPYHFRRDAGSTRSLIGLAHLWNRCVARIVGLRVNIVGSLPGGEGALVVSNHLSYMDILAYGSILPLRYTPKREIASWGLLGWYIGLSRPIWINRSSRGSSQKALRDFAKTMKRGMYLIVFPEGTSTDGKSGILAFKSTPFEAAITGNAPIVPAIIRYHQGQGEPTVCWYGDMTLLPHAWKILALRSVKAEVRFLPPVYPEGRSRKELAELVHGEMSAANLKR